MPKERSRPEEELPQKPGDLMGEPPPPFDTESRLEHTDVDAARMEHMKQGRAGGSRQGPEPEPTHGHGNRPSTRRDEGPQ
ncbi:MAG: hypothetical protein ACM3ML_16220 [Micromonosporaceae bacterium]